MSYSEAKALKALGQIKDPETGRDIVSAGLIGNLSFKEGLLRVILEINPNRTEHHDALRKAVEAELLNLPDVHKVTVLLTAHKDAPAIERKPQKKSGNPHQARRPEGYQGDAHIGKVIAVSSAKGGVGKSTISVNLAVALAKMGHRVGLLDADVHGPSVPILLGLNGKLATTHRVEGRMLIKPFEGFGIKVMSIGFLTKDDGPIVWRGPMVQGAISKMLWDVDWGPLDILIIDMPPGTGDPQLGLAQDIKPYGAVIVSTPQDLALADARKGIEMFAKVDIPVLGVVENMSVFTCPDCGTQHDIFGAGGAKSESEKMNVPFLGAAPLVMAIRESGDKGEPIAATDKPQGQCFEAIATGLMEGLRGADKAL